MPVIDSPDGMTTTDDADAATGVLELGPHLAGALVRYQPAAVGAGERLAPLAVRAFALADRLWATSLGPLSAAPEVR